MSTLSPLVVKCDRFNECKDRHDTLARRVEGIDERLRAQGESIAALRAQVAMWAAFGALAGGGLVSVAVNLVAK